MRGSKDNQWGRFTSGAFLLTVGIIFWLDRIGRLEARELLPWWPLVFLVIGLSHLAQRKWGSAMAFTLAGVILLMPMLGFARISPWRLFGLWPLFISAAGVTLLIQALQRPAHGPNRFHAVAVMAGNVRSIGSKEFRGGEAIAVMGGVDIDLRSALPHQGEAVIDVLAFWGGIGIRVPVGWRVINRTAEILGGYEDTTAAATDPNAPRLVIRGSVIMGGIEVKNSRERVA